MLFCHVVLSFFLPFSAELNLELYPIIRIHWMEKCKPPRYRSSKQAANKIVWDIKTEESIQSSERCHYKCGKGVMLSTKATWDVKVDVALILSLYVYILLTCLECWTIKSCTLLSGDNILVTHGTFLSTVPMSLFFLVQRSLNKNSESDQYSINRKLSLCGHGSHTVQEAYRLRGKRRPMHIPCKCYLFGN